MLPMIDLSGKGTVASSGGSKLNKQTIDNPSQYDEAGAPSNVHSVWDAQAPVDKPLFKAAPKPEDDGAEPK